MKSLVAWMAMTGWIAGRSQISSFMNPTDVSIYDTELLAQAQRLSRRLDDGSVASLSVADLDARLVKPAAETQGWQSKVEGEEVLVFTAVEGQELKILAAKIRADGDKKMLDLGNTDSEKFPAFRNNHALYSRGLGSSDKEEDVKKYVEEKLAAFKKSLAENKLWTVAEVAEDLKAFVATKGAFDVSLKQPRPHFALLVVLRTAADPHFRFNKVALHVRVHNIDADTLGVNVVQLDKEYQARLPKQGYQANAADVKKIIADLLEQKEHLTLTVEKVVDSFAQKFAPHCNNKPPTLANVVQEGAIYVAKVPEEAGCALANLKVVLEQFNYGYLQYVHVILDHALIRAEYMIGIDPKVFEENLTRVLDEVDREIASISKLRADSQKEYTVTVDDIEAALKEALGAAFAVVKEGDGLTAKQGDTVVCKAAKSEEGKYWKVSFITPFGKKPKGASNPEVFIEEHNAFDQIDRLKEHAKKFAEDIALL